MLAILLPSAVYGTIFVGGEQNNITLISCEHKAVTAALTFEKLIHHVRIMAPLTTLWIYAMATGEGYTAAILRGDFLVNTLGPNSYNCFLFHQMVGQWYTAATRPGEVRVRRRYFYC